jgi:aspartate/methionine/tyrosine aminotransferase
VARHSEEHQGLPLDWSTQTLMTVGATEALAAAIMGLLNRGDEARILCRSSLISVALICMA